MSTVITSVLPEQLAEAPSSVEFLLRKIDRRQARGDSDQG